MAEAPEPEQIAKYKILGFLGQGAMGKVYRGHDPVLNREVAIKTISTIMASDPDLQKRFHREAQAAARLNHPNIITVYEYGEVGDTMYIAMELLEGTDLKGCMETDVLKTLSSKLRIMEQVCEGLAFAHAKGVIHRDLKPANIHVSTAGQVKIMDFGLARLDSGDRSKAGMVVGTPNYMSPEQVMGDEIDARTDVFSLGAVFYELLACKKPFDADSVHGILFQVVHKEPTPIRQMVKELPPIVSEVVQKALAKDRGHRFQSAVEFREALTYVEHALAGGRAGEARLARAGDTTMMRASAPPAAPPSPGAGSAAAESVDGTVALDIKVPVKRPATRPGSSVASRPSAVGLRSGPRPVPPPSRRSFGVLLLVVLVLGLAAAGGIYYKRFLGESAGPEDQEGKSQSASMTAMTFALAKTKAELAQEKLQDKDYRQALVVAEEALRLQPRSLEAQAVHNEARRIIDDLEAAAKEARAAAQAGDSERAGAALSKVLTLDPKHPVVTEVAAQLNSSFQRQADEARRLADTARKEADAAGASSRPAYESATTTVRQAEAQLRSGSFAEATRGFLESRDLFDRARRAAQATPPPAPAAAVTAAPTTARVDAAPIVTEAPTAVASVEPAVAEARRSFVVGTNRIQTRRAGRGVAGFESSDVSVQQAADLHGQIDIEFNPPGVRGGDTYAIKATFTNFDRKALKIRDATLTYHVNGETRVQTVAPASKEAGPNQTVLLTEAGGVWEEGIQSWSLEIAVTSDKGESCRRDIRLAKR
jgi:tetratricopeptide (TPR) repeat protein